MDRPHRALPLAPILVVMLGGCALLFPPKLDVTPTSRVVDVAYGTTTTFTVANVGAAGSVLEWSFVSDALEAWPVSGSLAAGASQSVLVVVPPSVVGSTLTGRFVGPASSVTVQVTVTDSGPVVGCVPDVAYATRDVTQVIVGYHGPVAVAVERRSDVARASATLAAAYGGGVDRQGAGSEYDVLAVPTPTVDALLTELRARPEVSFAIRNEPIARAAAPNDPLYDGQWNLAGFGAEDAWAAADLTAAPEDVVVLAVVDDGVAVDHPDLAGRMLPGWDVHGNDGDVRNCTDHGTHVTGIAGAGRGDATGVAGVASVPWVALLPVKAWPNTDDPEETTGILAILDGMRWAAGLPVTGMPGNPFPADVVNLSLGTPSDSVDLAFRAVIDDLHAAGVIVLAAAGNAGTGTGVQYPARSGAIAVGSVDQDFGRSSFSTYGTGLDLMAPGGFGTNPGCGLVTSTGVVFSGGTATETWTCKAGTSMSTPYASAAAALLLGSDPVLRADPDRVAAVEVALLAAAAKAPGANATEYGAGVLCLDALLTSDHVCGVATPP